MGLNCSLLFILMLKSFSIHPGGNPLSSHFLFPFLSPSILWFVFTFWKEKISQAHLILSSLQPWFLFVDNDLQYLCETHREGSYPSHAHRHLPRGHFWPCLRFHKMLPVSSSLVKRVCETLSFSSSLDALACKSSEGSEMPCGQESRLTAFPN